mmetsp:Transcript_38761/g.51075  ORF Transcript_38761/g.51075 Transcript_38761/m.51075 type:complete len:685 (-) Transcript_38761:228-2282(-)
MDEISDVIQEIVKGCAAEGVNVSELLAAFVCRTIIESSDSQVADEKGGKPVFSLDRQLVGDDINELINRCIERLLEQDSPSLETVKMQVAFDSSYLQQEEKTTKKKQQRQNHNRELQRGIVMVRPQNANDYDTLTTLYRQIFNFLLQHYTPEASTDRAVEREVAAALESVFPRIGLKAFIQLTNDEKYEQLEELASIVLGIRLFNRKVGKGGAGIPSIDNEVTSWVESMTKDLNLEVELLTSTCQQHQETIVHLHLRQPKGVTPEMMDRWKDELANRRQYLSYLQSLQEDLVVSSQKVGALLEQYNEEVRDLGALIGSRTSVPKEHVYPKFDSIARLWIKLDAEHKVVKARAATLEELHRFRSSYSSTLSESSPLVQSAQEAKAPSLEEEAQAALAAVAAAKEGLDGTDSKAEGKDSGLLTAEGKGELEKDGGQKDGERPVRLSIESTPEFMQLPLEFQGFCSWTIVNRRGLLLPGRPELGVVRYKNSFYVFAHEVAIRSFIDNPEAITEGVVVKAMQSPELIHLLRLQHCFPQQSITRILRGPDQEAGVFLAAAPPEKKDASTATPTHFVEKHIDPSYEWNEWALRRRALKYANLRNCATTSQQTDDSHFRRQNETQVYLPKEKTTQTTKERGTNPPRQINFLAGLRGPNEDAKAVSKYIPQAKDSGDKDDKRPAVVNLTFEL